MPLWLEMVCCALFCLAVHEVKDRMSKYLKGKRKNLTEICPECGMPSTDGDLCRRCFQRLIQEVKKLKSI